MLYREIQHPSLSLLAANCNAGYRGPQRLLVLNEEDCLSMYIPGLHFSLSVSGHGVLIVLG